MDIAYIHFAKFDIFFAGSDIVLTFSKVWYIYFAKWIYAVIDKILYLDVLERVSGYDDLLGKLDDDMKVVENDEKLMYSPLILFVADGKKLLIINKLCFLNIVLIIT